MENVKLNFLHVCDQVLISDGKASIIGIFNEIKVANFPAAHPKFSIISGISGKAGIYTQIIEILTPSGSNLAMVSGQSEIKRDMGKNNFVANFVNFVFSEEGKYKIVVKIDDEILNKDNGTYILVRKTS